MKKILIVVLVILVVASIVWWYYNPQNRVDRVLSEVGAVPQMKGEFLSEIKKQECKSLVKGDFWTVEDCNSEVYYKIFFDENGYHIGYCADLGSVKETFQEVGPHMNPPRACINPTEEAQLVNSEGSISAYNVCGLSIILQNGCLIGVGE